MKTADIIKSLDAALATHHALAMAELERLATDILISRKNAARSFVCAMGVGFFSDKHGELIDRDSVQYLNPVYDLLDNLDPVLHLTGTPLRLEIDHVTGGVQVATDW